ncbi:MAG: hypothetical protein HQL75_02300 [Magnetococcales bacterium]|nr:hypothetical protein [Magnetococcales bacterium]
MPLFKNLQQSHRTSLLELRNRTTYLWPEILRTCRNAGTTLTCSIRAKTLLEVEGALLELQDAGFFIFHKSTDGQSDPPKLYRLQIQGITDHFKQVINSMEPAPLPRPKGLVQKIKSRLLGA